MESIEIKAYAKLNLTLNILNLREDGFHNIDSVFQAIDLFDVIDIKKEKVSSMRGAFLEDNIAEKARRTVELHIGERLYSEINVNKAIPISSGMGGGSSDAAAVISGLNEVFNLGFTATEIMNLGLSVGSDVPYFLSKQGTARVTGRGENVAPVQWDVADYYAIVRPHKRLSTKLMYESHKDTGKSFFEIAKGLCPAVERLYDHFMKFSDSVGMSGSGPTVFAGFGSYDSAVSATECLGKYNGDIFIVRPVKTTMEQLLK